MKFFIAFVLLVAASTDVSAVPNTYLPATQNINSRSYHYFSAPSSSAYQERNAATSVEITQSFPVITYNIPAMQGTFNPAIQSLYSAPLVQQEYSVPQVQTVYAATPAVSYSAPAPAHQAAYFEAPAVQTTYSATAGIQATYAAVPAIQTAYTNEADFQTGYNGAPATQPAYLPAPAIQATYSAAPAVGYSAPEVQSAYTLSGVGYGFQTAPAVRYAPAYNPPSSVSGVATPVAQTIEGVVPSLGYSAPAVQSTFSAPVTQQAVSSPATADQIKYSGRNSGYMYKKDSKRYL